VRVAHHSRRRRPRGGDGDRRDRSGEVPEKRRHADDAFESGGGSDVFLREMAPHLARIMGIKVVVENLAGGSGAKAMSVVSRAKPDGGTFYATTPTFVYTSLLSKPPATYRDLEPLVNIFYDPESSLYTATNSNFKTLQQVIDQARAEKGAGAERIRRRSSVKRSSV
jgi:tripartite-type tricarboxylate transporter receptor subunit TctC